MHILTELKYKNTMQNLKILKCMLLQKQSNKQNFYFMWLTNDIIYKPPCTVTDHVVTAVP